MSSPEHEKVPRSRFLELHFFIDYDAEKNSRFFKTKK